MFSRGFAPRGVLGSTNAVQATRLAHPILAIETFEKNSLVVIHTGTELPLSLGIVFDTHDLPIESRIPMLKRHKILLLSRRCRDKCPW